MKSKWLNFKSLIYILIVFISACDDDIQKSDEQEVFFEVSYTNAAWSKQYKGFIVDKNGRVMAYENPAKWNKVDDGASLSVSQMQENLFAATTSAIVVSTEDLRNYTAKIGIISDSTYSKPISGGADQGVIRFYAYRFDQVKQHYIPFLLAETGDFEMHSNDKSAIEISTWLGVILNKLY